MEERNKAGDVIPPEVFPRSRDENSKFSAVSTAGKRNASVCVLSFHFRCGANPFSMRNRQRYVSNKSRWNEIRNLRIAYQNSIYIYSGAALDPFSRRHASLHAKNSRDFNLQSALAFLIISIEQLKKKKIPLRAESFRCLLV